MTRLVVLLAAALVACGAEVRVPERRCVETCARRVLDSYDDGAPLAAEAVQEWIAFCERLRGPCCEKMGVYAACFETQREVEP